MGTDAGEVVEIDKAAARERAIGPDINFESGQESR
jgi:hypothetical protein